MLMLAFGGGCCIVGESSTPRVEPGGGGGTEREMFRTGAPVHASCVPGARLLCEAGRARHYDRRRMVSGRDRAVLSACRASRVGDLRASAHARYLVILTSSSA